MTAVSTAVHSCSTKSAPRVPSLVLAIVQEWEAMKARLDQLAHIPLEEVLCIVPTLPKLYVACWKHLDRSQESKTSAIKTDPDTETNEASKTRDSFPFFCSKCSFALHRSMHIRSLTMTARPKKQRQHKDLLSLTPLLSVNLTRIEIGHLHVGYRYRWNSWQWQGARVIQ